MPKLPKSKIKITFEQPGWEEVEVFASTISLGDALALDGLGIEERLTALAGALSSWNITDDDDRPLPCTLAGLKSLEYAHAKAILEGWVEAITSVPAPLERRSSDTLPWEAASIPTEPLS